MPFIDDYDSRLCVSSRPSSPHKYSPATRAEDISRLLDPSYSSASSSSSSPHSHSPFVYVDHHGHIHDPDYRDFPPLVLPKRSHSTRSPSSACHSLAALHATRPPWYQDDALSDRDDDDDDEDDDEDDLGYDSRSRSSRRSSIQTRPSPHSHSHHHHHHNPRDYRQTYTTYAYSTLEPSPPLDSAHAFPTDDSTDIYFHDDREKLRKPHRSKKTAQKERRAPSEKSARGPLLASDALAEEDEQRGDDDDDDDDDDDGDEHEQPGEPESEWTPTCTQAMRRQWQAISLRFRSRLFRAQRAVRRRVKGGG